MQAARSRGPRTPAPPGENPASPDGDPSAQAGGPRLPGKFAACVLGALALLFGAGSWRLGYWVDGEPGSGLLPLGASVLLLACAVPLFFAPKVAEEEARFGRTPLFALALLVAYGLALAFGGIVVPSVCFGVLWMCMLHRRPLLPSLFASVLLTAAGTLFFKLLLKAPLNLWPALS